MATRAEQYEAAVVEMARGLPGRRPEWILADFPTAFASSDELCQFQHTSQQLLSLHGSAAIEDVFPVSPMQKGILVSQERQPGLYDIHALWIVRRLGARAVDPERLRVACEQVIARHQIFRTCFVEAPEAQNMFLQVVLEGVAAPVSSAKRQTADELSALTDPDIHAFGRLPYHFQIGETVSGDVYLRLDVSRALVDGTSMGVLLRDIAVAYDGNLGALGPAPPYRVFVDHLRALAAGEAVEYWKEFLHGAGPCRFPPLNEDAGQKTLFSDVDVPLQEPQASQLRQFCREQNMTIANLVSTIWAVILQAFLGPDHGTVCFGYLGSGRDVPIRGAELMAGPMMTMMVRRVELEAGTTFRTLVARVQEDFVRGLPYERCPLADIHDALELGGRPLFNTVVNVQRAVSREDSTATIAFEGHAGRDPSEYDITLNVTDSGSSVALSLSYWGSTLSAKQARSLANTVQAAISSALARPDARVSDLDLVSSQDLEAICSWNEPLAKPVGSCIHQEIDRQAVLNPGAPAVCSDDVNLSYKELHRLAASLASKLVSLGVGPETLVPFCFDKSAWAAVAMVAILKAGGGCAGLDPTHPKERLRGIIDDTGAKVVVTAPQHEGLFADMVPTTVSVDSAWAHQLASPGATQVELPVAQPHTPAFVIFTSGSTGTPKGIVVEHGAFCSSVEAHAPRLGFHRGSRVLQFAAYTYGLSIAETFTTLMTGGCVCVPAEHDRLNGLAAVITRLRVNWMFLTPTVASLLRPDEVPLVETLVLGGEHATQGNLDSWAPRVCLINSYGPAECSIWTNANVRVRPSSSPSNIGRRLGAPLWVVDARNHDRLLPPGCPGELLVGGSALARGYLNDTAKTDAAFIKRPAWMGRIAVAQPDRFYKTGDIVRYNVDGSLSFVGRKDSQVKVHGHRIELSEVEHHVGRAAGIRHAAALLPSAGSLGGRLVAVVALEGIATHPQTGRPVVLLGSKYRDVAARRQAETRVAMEQWLPDHMMPRFWVFVEQMPLLASGKLDRRALRRFLEAVEEDTYQEIVSLATPASESAPSNDTEEELRNIWAEVLGLPRDAVSMARSFLSLGGDSVSAMRMASRARARGINISARDILVLRTIPALATQAAGKASPEPVSQTRPFSLLPVDKTRLDAFIQSCVSRLRLTDRGDIEDIFPCSSMQEGILISQAKAPDRYRIRALWRVHTEQGSVDAGKLQEAWDAVVQRHQMLRAVFVEAGLDGAGFMQVILRKVSAPMHVVECDTVEQFKSLAEADAYPDDWLPYRLTICTTRCGDVYCKFVANRAIDDGSSTQVMLRDVNEAYSGRLASGAPPLYGDYVAYARNQPAEKAISFWKSYLEDVEPCYFPALGRQTGSLAELLFVEHHLDDRQAARLHRLCEALQVTLADLFNTVWAVVLRAYLGSDAVCHGCLTSGRDAPVHDVDDVLGPLINMLVCRSAIDGAASVVELLRRNHASRTASLEHQHCALKEIWHHAAGSGRQSLFNTIVNVQRKSSAFWRDQGFAEELVFSCETMYNPTEFDLRLDVLHHQGGIDLMLGYWTSFVSAEQASGILSTVITALGGLVDNPNQRIDDLALCSEIDRARIADWVSDAPSPPGCLHDAIDKQALAQPDAEAACSREGSLTYRELSDLSNRVAHQLIGLGVGPEVVSLWGVVAIVAILKAGGACVALDPEHPEGRKQDTIRDVGASVALASSSQAPRLAGLVSKVVPVSAALLAHLPGDTTPVTAVSPSNAAFVVYTSGSTGKPKGAVLEHRNLVAFAGMHGRLGLTRGSRVGHFASYMYDVSIEETVVALMHGACVCILSEEDRLGGLSQAVTRMEISWMEVTPTVARMLEPADAVHLQTLVLGGELLTDDVVDKWAGKVDLFNTYGPCECAVTCTLTEPLSPGAPGAIVGRPFASSLWIVNANNVHELAPVGAVGELLIEGPLVGRGYLNDEARTRDAFLTGLGWAGAASASRRFYRTGDLARWTADGSVEYVGRKDGQVKIRGQRVELGEVEHHMSLSPVVRMAVACVPRGGWLQKKLVALLVPKEAELTSQGGSLEPIDGRSLSPSTAEELVNIRAALGQRLPRHMVPWLWIAVKGIPLLPSGKVNRRLIQQWLENMDQDKYGQIAASLQNSAARHATTAMELYLQSIWSQVLDIPQHHIGTDQSLFHLGGDSVAASQIIARCRADGVALTVKDVFVCKTIQELAPRASRRV